MNDFAGLVAVVVVKFPPIAVAVELEVAMAVALVKTAVTLELEFVPVELVPTPCATTAG